MSINFRLSSGLSLTSFNSFGEKNTIFISPINSPIFLIGKLLTKTIFFDFLENSEEKVVDSDKIEAGWQGCDIGPRTVEEIAKEKGVQLKAIHLQSKEQAQNAPTPITTYALFYNGEYLTNEQMNDKRFLKLLEKINPS